MARERIVSGETAGPDETHFNYALRPQTFDQYIGQPKLLEKLRIAADNAVAALVALGERRADAEALLDRVRAAHPEMKATDALLREMLQLRKGRG